MRRSYITLTIILIVITALGLVLQSNTTTAQSDNGIPEFCQTLSDPTNVCIDESVRYYRATSEEERPVSEVSGFLYWQSLEGTGLNFFINISDIIGDVKIYDPARPNDPNGVDYELGSDRMLIRAKSTQFAYSFKAYYDPDEVGDTGFIVVFQSQVVNFGLPGVEDTEEFYAVDYRNRITLPKKAGIVSYAPSDIEHATLEEIEPDVFSIVWEYRNRKMDSKHDPLIIEVTYKFDDIYLQFTRLIYQNRIEKQNLIDKLQRLDLLNASFQIIAFLSVLASLISILMAYLLARRRYEPEKKKARELPRRQAMDVERSKNMEIPIRRMISSFVILGLVVTLPFISPVTAQSLENQNIQWYGQYEIFEDNTIKLTVDITVPVPQNTFKIWENMSAIRKDTINVRDENGAKINFEIKEDHILINNPPLRLIYSYTYEWTPDNFGGMLVFLDRFWLEFYNPNQDPNIPEDNYLAADIDYNVVLPQKALVYSASPSDLVTRTRDPDGRSRLRFVDKGRQIDAFHDAWEVQVSYSYVSVFEAIENLNVNYDNVKVEQKNTIEYIQSSQSELLIFALLGVIAPILAFLIAYWVFRNKYLKEIERLQQENEEQIFVEEEQIGGFLSALSPENKSDFRKAYLGHYFLLRNKIAHILKKNISKLDIGKIEQELMKRNKEIDYLELIRLLEEGMEVELSDLEVGYDQLVTYAEDVEELLKLL